MFSSTYNGLSKVLAILELSYDFSEKIWTHFSRFYEPLYKSQASNISQINEQARKRPPKMAKIITTSSLNFFQISRKIIFKKIFRAKTKSPLSVDKYDMVNTIDLAEWHSQLDLHCLSTITSNRYWYRLTPAIDCHQI